MEIVLDTSIARSEGILTSDRTEPSSTFGIPVRMKSCAPLSPRKVHATARISSKAWGWHSWVAPPLPCRRLRFSAPYYRLIKWMVGTSIAGSDSEFELLEAAPASQPSVAPEPAGSAAPSVAATASSPVAPAQSARTPEPSHNQPRFASAAGLCNSCYLH